MKDGYTVSDNAIAALATTLLVLREIDRGAARVPEHARADLAALLPALANVARDVGAKLAGGGQ